MQRLANMANCVRSAVMLVQQAAAARKVEQRQADQRRADAPQRRPRQSWTELPHLIARDYTNPWPLDGPNPPLVAHRST